MRTRATFLADSARHQSSSQGLFEWVLFYRVSNKTGVLTFFSRRTSPILDPNSDTLIQGNCPVAPGPPNPNQAGMLMS